MSYDTPLCHCYRILLTMAGAGVTVFSPTPTCYIPVRSFPPRASFKPAAIRFVDRYSSNRWKRRGAAVVTGAVPGANSYIFAFVLPLSLLAVTTFASIRIADKLDDDFLQELAVNEALKEEDEEEEEEGEKEIKPEEKQPVLGRTRNRPRREA